MSERKHNFNPGPAIQPQCVLEQIGKEILNWHNSGLSVTEMSHRSHEFESILDQAKKDLRHLLDISNEYKVLFLQGGAHLQFSMVPMNLGSSDKSADYIITGSWGNTAFKEATKLSKATIAFTGKGDNYNSIPSQQEISLNSQAPYVHFTSNETIQGVQWQKEPIVPTDIPLVADCSSDILSRPIDINKYGLIYAGAQKNAGPAGVTLVIIREDLLEYTHDTELPLMLDYKLMAESKSLFNTPPCFNIYMVGLVLQWLKDQGGLTEIAKQNQAKASLVYRTIDQSTGYYRGHAKPDSRSQMNITFRLPEENLEKEFVALSEKENFVGLKGHRSVGGLRASLYNAQTVEAVQALTEFMKEFQRKNG